MNIGLSVGPCWSVKLDVMSCNMHTIKHSRKLQLCCAAVTLDWLQNVFPRQMLWVTFHLIVDIHVCIHAIQIRFNTCLMFHVAGKLLLRCQTLQVKPCCMCPLSLLACF